MKWFDGTRGRIGTTAEVVLSSERSNRKSCETEIDVRKVRSMLPGALAELREVCRSFAIKLFDRYPQDLGGEFGPLHIALRQIARRDGQLHTIKLERDRDAEDKLLARKRPARP